MKKNYNAPATRIITIAAARMVCTSNCSNMTISSTETTSQWSRESEYWDDEEE